MIYIDPPYNRGNEFRYNDKLVDNEDAYSNSKWLSFIFNRLKLAKKLLREDGLIFISIDENEFAQLKLLCDDNNLFTKNNLNTLQTSFVLIVILFQNNCIKFEEIK